MKNFPLLCLLLAPMQALAHAMLEGAQPQVGSTVRVAPAELELTFSEGLEPRFSTVAVTGPDGSSVTAGALHTDPADATHLFVPVGKLPPGRYAVRWHAVSVDTHRTQGTYSFTVVP